MTPPSLTSLRAQNLFDLTDVVAIVTGGSGGIGLMISSVLVANGAKVYIIDLDEKQVMEMAERYTELAKEQGCNGRMIGLKGDVGSKAEAKRLADLIGSKEDYVTCLFNNAGIKGAPTVQPTTTNAQDYHDAYFSLTESDFTSVSIVNSIGPYFLSVAFLSLLSRNRSIHPPSIINTVSMNGWTKDPSTSGRAFPYLSSKASIGQLTSQLAHDFLPLNIRVNAIAPGYFITSMGPGTKVDEYGICSTDSTDSWELFGFHTPARKGAGGVKDVGSVALMLVTNEFVNGETVLVDGGTLLMHPSSY